ncbi:LicD family-domain-containing protein [Astrocystis sublimbata]|nr:LicD family-domain-containing protein [Astrocystis sublimbata]
MRFLHPFSMLFLAIQASPIVVVETKVITRQAIPTERLAVQVNSTEHDAKQQQQPPVPVPVPATAPKPKEKKPKDTIPKEFKYFNEAGMDMKTGHYDKRYFRGIVAYDDHKVMLRHLIRSYLKTCNALGVETWLAHGSLLGWWWNGHVMPWDHDLDVQLSWQTMAFLGERYNRTMHEYLYETFDSKDKNEGKLHINTAADSIARGMGIDLNSKAVDASVSRDGRMKRKKYFLDINPYHGAMDKGDGSNIIDGRWIDTDNGLFIDLTVVRERDPEHSPGVWSCKNRHRYRTDELWPMRRTEFEDVEALIPYAFEKILVDEYKANSLVLENYHGHYWSSGLKQWVLQPKDESQEKSKDEPQQMPKEEPRKEPSQQQPPVQLEHQNHPQPADGSTNPVVVYKDVIVEV